MKRLKILLRYLDNFVARNFVNFYIWRRTGGMVASGPFRGMRYVKDSVGSRLTPKYLGTYEMELSPTMEKICRENFDVIIDVGAAEGYYAVGLAMKNPKTKIIAFETETRGRELLKKMAETNGVSGRVSVLGNCDIKSLSSVIDETKKCFVMMDIEGAERELLDNVKIPKLNKCFILVEAHECVVPGIREIIMDRFRKTHRFVEIKERARGPEDFPISLPLVYRSLLKRYFVTNSMNEARFDSLAVKTWSGRPWSGRPEKNAGWFYFEPK